MKRKYRRRLVRTHIRKNRRGCEKRYSRVSGYWKKIKRKMEHDIRYGRDTLSMHIFPFSFKPSVKEAKYWINHINEFHSKDTVALKEKEYFEQFIELKKG